MAMKWRDCRTDADRWAWHAEVYAFRRVVLGAPDDERTSPSDPDGAWFDARLVSLATEKMRAKRQTRTPPNRDSMAIGQALCHQWATNNGYANWEHAAENGRSYGEVVSAIFAQASDKLASKRNPGKTP